MKRSSEISGGSNCAGNKFQHHGFTKEFQNNSVKTEQQSHILKDVCGQIKLVGAPYYSLVLVLGNGSNMIPLVPVDSARHLVDWISSVGRRAVIKQLLAVSEHFQILKENTSLVQENYIVKWKNVKILEENEMQSDNDFENNNEVLEVMEDVKFTITGTENITESQRSCRIVVHHVSTPFHVDESATGTCLVFISYSNRNHIESKLWVVLQAEQVAWREFLIPNREYLLHFPPGTDKFFFDSSQKPLDTIMKKNIRELRVIFHHKILFSKYSILNGSTVPPGSKLYLTPNTSFSGSVYRFTADSLWFKSWFSTCEADHANVPLVTFYGKVSSILYLKEEVFKSCYLCNQKKPREPELNSPKSSISQVWVDPFKSGLELEENVLIELPNVYRDGDSRMKTGVPGELVQVVKLQDLSTGEERSVYIKHSYVSSCQQLVRLAAGTSVCISHLNRRCSSTGKCYYITTVLSCCRVLDYMDGDSQSEGWGLYGMCQMKTDPLAKTWGVLEPFDVSKVAIRAKCDYCGNLISQGRCSNCARNGTHTTSAYAIAWVNLVHDNKTITLEKVLIKDGLVRKLLCIPEKMWQMLLEAAVQEEILAFTDKPLNELPALTPLRRSFQMYCSIKSREKFYISLKKISSQDDGDLYYCINLEPVNKDRLSIVAELVMKASH